MIGRFPIGLHEEDPLNVIIKPQREVLTEPLRRVYDSTKLMPDKGKYGMRSGNSHVKRVFMSEPTTGLGPQYDIPHGQMTVLTDSLEISKFHFGEDMESPGIRTTLQFLTKALESPIVWAQQEVFPQKRNKFHPKIKTEVALYTRDDKIEHRRTQFMLLVVSKSDMINMPHGTTSQVVYNTLDGECRNVSLRFYNNEIGNVTFDYNHNYHRGTVELDETRIGSHAKAPGRDLLLRPVGEVITKGNIRIELQPTNKDIAYEFETPVKIDVKAELERMAGLMEHGFKYDKR